MPSEVKFRTLDGMLENGALTQATKQGQHRMCPVCWAPTPATKQGQHRMCPVRRAPTQATKQGQCLVRWAPTPATKATKQGQHRMCPVRQALTPAVGSVGLVQMPSEVKLGTLD